MSLGQRVRERLSTSSTSAIEESVSEKIEEKKRKYEKKILRIVFSNGREIVIDHEPPYTAEEIIPIINKVLKEGSLGATYVLFHNGRAVRDKRFILTEGGVLHVRGVDIAG